MKKFITLFFILSFFSVALFSQEISGNWKVAEHHYILPQSNSEGY